VATPPPSSRPLSPEGAAEECAEVLLSLICNNKKVHSCRQWGQQIRRNNLKQNRKKGEKKKYLKTRTSWQPADVGPAALKVSQDPLFFLSRIRFTTSRWATSDQLAILSPHTVQPGFQTFTSDISCQGFSQFSEESQLEFGILVLSMVLVPHKLLLLEPTGHSLLIFLEKVVSLDLPLFLLLAGLAGVAGMTACLTVTVIGCCSSSRSCRRSRRSRWRWRTGSCDPGWTGSGAWSLLGRLLGRFGWHCRVVLTVEQLGEE
jgi:hypothetical protein